MPRYRVELPGLAYLVEVVRQFGSKYKNVLDIYNLGRDPRVLELTTDKSLTQEDINLISRLVPLNHIRIIELKEES